jgi:hypothetical protein
MITIRQCASASTNEDGSQLLWPLLFGRFRQIPARAGCQREAIQKSIVLICMGFALWRRPAAGAAASSS